MWQFFLFHLYLSLHSSCLYPYPNWISLSALYSSNLYSTLSSPLLNTRFHTTYLTVFHPASSLYSSFFSFLLLFNFFPSHLHLGQLWRPSHWNDQSSPPDSQTTLPSLLCAKNARSIERNKRMEYNMKRSFQVKHQVAINNDMWSIITIFPL